MNTKLVITTEAKDTEQWTDLPFIPRIDEWVNLRDILEKEEIIDILHSARCWSCIRGKVQSVEYRHDDNDFYVEIFIRCED